MPASEKTRVSHGDDFCGGEQYFQHKDFMPIFDFNTPAMRGALGVAVSPMN